MDDAVRAMALLLTKRCHCICHDDPTCDPALYRKLYGRPCCEHTN